MVAPEHHPSLAALEFLAGEWEMELSNASFLPPGVDAAQGYVTFEWIEGGALLVMRQRERDEHVPSARWAIGRDGSSAEYVVLYADTRGVSRIYAMSLEDGCWRMWRDHPGFSQRFAGTVSADRKRIEARWEKSLDGMTWEHDFDLTYTRR